MPEAILFYKYAFLTRITVKLPSCKIAVFANNLTSVNPNLSKMNVFTSIAKKSTLILGTALFSVITASAFTPVSSEPNANIAPEPTTSVVYQSIIVTKTDKSVLLDWNTASEYRNGYFEVERSTNATDFKTVALVLDGFSTEGSGKKYAFKENLSNLKNGSAYYRLKQFDEYGNISYSAIVKVK